MLVLVVGLLSCTKENVNNSTPLTIKSKDELLPIKKGNNLYQKLIVNAKFKGYDANTFGLLNENEIYVYYPSDNNNFFAIVINTSKTYASFGACYKG